MFAVQQKLTNENESNSSSIHRSPRILSRRYSLTKTGYKYLEIGINVSPSSQVEIALGDSRGIEIHFTHDVWKAFLDQRDAINNFFNNDEETSKTIGHITLRFGKINNLKVLRLETSTLYIVMSSSTVYNMFALEYCIDCIIQSLSNITNMINIKFMRLREIANRAKDPISFHKMIHENESFDKNDIIDCELISQVFGS